MPFWNDLYYEVQGEGPALLLLHGHTLDRRTWEGLLPGLTPRYRVITPDLPGHGLSGDPPGEAPTCDLLAGLLDHLSVERAALCGLSMGGAEAISLALHHPERCAALILVDAALRGHRFQSWPGPRPYVKQARAEGLGPALAAWLADPLFAPALASPAADRLAAMVRAFPGGPWLGAPAPPDPPGPPDADRLGEIAAPTLVVVGEHDLPDFQAVAHRIADAVPGATRAVIADSGHLPPMEQPDAFLAAVLPFLAQTMGA